MTTTLQKGANAPIPHAKFSVKTAWTKAATNAPDIDASAFLLNAEGKVLSDDHFVFFNQNASPDGGIAWSKAPVGADFAVDLSRLPDTVAKVVIAATVDGTPRPISAYSKAELRLEGPDGAAMLTFPADLSDASEAALIMGEIYRRNGEWKFRAVAQGFNGGLAPLARQYGVDVAEEEPVAPTSPPAPTPPPAPKPEPAPAPKPVSLSKIDLRKEKVGVTLAKKGIADVQARIAAVMDRSGSMASLYSRGVVQDTFERIVPVALRMSPQPKMDTWFFASEYRKTPDCTPDNLDGYVERHVPPNGGLFRRGDGIGFGNDEAPCMLDVIEHFTRLAPSDLPTFVLFFHDGGITDNAGITRVMKEAASKPIFWQFVGLGRGNFGILQKLDDMKGRVVDNCDFFALPDITKVSDEDLYDRLLNEFPGWLKAARAKGILR